MWTRGAEKGPRNANIANGHGRREPGKPKDKIGE